MCTDGRLVKMTDIRDTMYRRIRIRCVAAYGYDVSPHTDTMHRRMRIRCVSKNRKFIKHFITS
jgi:hypothetical protein